MKLSNKDKDSKGLPKEFKDPISTAKQAEESMRRLLKALSDKDTKAEDTIHRICEKLNQIENDLPKDEVEKVNLLWKVKQQYLELVTSQLTKEEVDANSSTLVKIPLYLSIVIYDYYHKFVKDTYNLIRDEEFAQSEKRRQGLVELAKKLEQYETDYDKDVIKSKVDPTQKGTLQGILKTYKVDYTQDIKYINNQIINIDVFTEEVKTPRPNIKDKDELAIEAERDKPPEPGLFKKLINFLKNKKNKGKEDDKQE